MLTVLLLILLLIASGCSLLQYTKVCTSLLISAILLFLVTGCGLLPLWLIANLAVSYNSPIDWKDRNAIVLLGGGVSKLTLQASTKPATLAYSKIYEATRLYRNCKASQGQCTLIISGGKEIGELTEAEIYRNELLAIGIDKHDIKLESDSQNLFKSAQFTSLIIKSNHYDSIVLVSSNINLKRALMDFAHFNIQAIPVAADSYIPLLSIIPKGFNFMLADLAMHEYIGIARYSLYNLLGRNIKASEVSP